MNAITARLLRKLLTAEAFGLMLVFLALQTTIYGISASLRMTDTRLFFYVSFVGASLGFGLSKNKSNWIQASAWTAALGMIGVWILAAGLTSPLWEFFKVVLATTPHIVPALRSHESIDTTAITSVWNVVAQYSSALALHLRQWIIDVQQNAKLDDPLVRSMMWILIIWLLAAWMGWFAQKRSAILSLLPGLVLLALVTSYSEYKVETTWLTVFILLVLMGVWNYRDHTLQWEKRKIDYADSIRTDISQAVLFLSLGIATLAFITPSVSWRELRDYLRQHSHPSRSEAAQILGIREQAVATRNVTVQLPSLPREHLLTEGVEQSQNIVMTIRTGELPPLANSSVEIQAPHYYWRSVIYDQYAGAGWVTSAAPKQNYSANTPLLPGLLNGYKILHLNVQIQEPQGNLFWSGILFSADVPLAVYWRLRPPTSLFADQFALIQSDMFATATERTNYIAESYTLDVSMAELRAATTEYPDYIREHYLGLPGSLPDRVRQLAKQVVNGKANPYEKAKAIERYLRANYPYDLQVPAPPEGADVADYFLFDLKRGYCDYYATAMVVMARLNGIPARFVSGYSSGTYNAASAEYVIRELNAHSWAEVYFPNIGWVEFEPTASLPEIDRAESRRTIPTLPEDDAAASKILTRFRLERVGYIALPFALLLLGTLLYFTLIEKWRYMSLAPAVAIERIYHKFYRVGRPLAGAPTFAETSFEFTEKIINTITEKQRSTRFRDMYVNTIKEAVLLTDMYNAILFREVHTQRIDFLAAWHAWSNLRWRLRLARLIESLMSLRGTLLLFATK